METRETTVRDLVAAWNRHTNPAAFWTDAEHAAHNAAARLVLASLRARYCDGVDFGWHENGRMIALRAEGGAS